MGTYRKASSMHNKTIKTVYLFVIALISLLFIYPTQTLYYPLTVDLKNSQSIESTPVLDQAYILRNKNWHNHRLNVNINALPLSTQKQLIKDTRKLEYPLRYTNHKNAIQIIIQTPTAGAHALTTNGGNTIMISKDYIKENQSNPKKLASTMTHELGHALGLLHTNQQTIMYPFNASAQPLVLNTSQKLYIHHLSSVSFLTRLATRVTAPVWQAEDVNHYRSSKQLGTNNINVFASKSATSPNLITVIILVFNLIPILIIADILYNLYVRKILNKYLT